MEYQSFNAELKRLLSEELCNVNFDNIHYVYNSFKTIVLCFESRRLPQITGYSFAAEFNSNGFGRNAAALRLELQLSVSDNGYNFMEYAFVEIDLVIPRNLVIGDFFERYWTIDYKKLISALEAFEQTSFFGHLSKMNKSSLRFDSGEV